MLLKKSFGYNYYFKWFTYKNNSCRYDSFITMNIFILQEYINNINITQFKLLNEFEKLISNVKMIPDENKRNDIWQFCIDNQIGILQTMHNNSNIVLDNGYEKYGMICQLFSLFKNNEHFCLVSKNLKHVNFVGLMFHIHKIGMIYLYI